MNAAIEEQRRRVAAAEAKATDALAALSAPYEGPEGSLQQFTEAEDRHEALVDAEADLLREQAKLAEMEKTR